MKPPLALGKSARAPLLFLLLAPFCAPRIFAVPHAAARAVTKVRIAEGIYLFAAPDLDDFYPEGNTTVIVSEYNVLVFDTDFLPSTARTILGEIRQLTDKPVRYVVNSHWHPDHWSGNEVYAQEFPNLSIIATEQTRQFMKGTENGFPYLWTRFVNNLQTDYDREVNTGKKADGSALTDAERRKDEETLRLDREYVAEAVKVRRTLPTLTYEDKLTLYEGGREFRFMSLAGDAPGATVLYLPKEKVLVTGDLLVAPIPFSSSHPTQWLNSLKALARLDADTIVPGHGAAEHDKSYLNLVAELVESVIDQVRAALERGVISVEEAQQLVKADALRPKFTHGDKELDQAFTATVKNLVKQAYDEVRDAHEWKR